MQVRKIRLHVIQYLVGGTSIQSLRWRPVANVCYSAEILHLKEFRQARFVEHGVHGIGECPIRAFCSTVRCRIVWDRGVQLDTIVLADVVHLAHR